MNLRRVVSNENCTDWKDGFRRCRIGAYYCGLVWTGWHYCGWIA